MKDKNFSSEKSDVSPEFIVAIGASAGGLEALEEFFGNLSNDTDACFIVVQHLSPDFKSMMPELLSKHTDMPVYQVSDGFTLEKNSVYLMPARTSMLIDNKMLRLSDQNPYRHLHMPIDIFFNSLAHDQKHKAVGIILSGTGSDGTRGIKTIKELDGLVLVQDPESAKFDGMPNSAERTGLVDLILKPNEMGEYLQRFISQPADKPRSFNLKHETNATESKLEEIFSILKKQSSINFAQYKSSTVARRIERRLAITESHGLDAYLRLLLESPKEIQILCRELLINVTRFFRDADAFNYLQTHVIPKIVAQAVSKDEDVRVWVAACSTGEEAYSIAILIDEEIKRRGHNCKAKIFATDVDGDVIATASAGIYPKDITSDVTPERIDKYFSARDNTYEISQHIRQTVIFASHNMIDDAPFSNLNLVTCRNVLIYFQHAAQKKVLSSLYFALIRDGFLFLGNSESLGDIKTQYTVEHEKFKLFKKTTNLRVPIGSSPPIRDLMPISRNVATGMAPISNALRSHDSTKNPLSSVLDRLIKDYAPDCIVLNDTHDAIHVYGNVGPYTKGITAGRISNSIKDIIIDDLSVAISTALYRCEKNSADVFYKDVVVKTDPKTQIIIDLSVLYIKENNMPNSAGFYVVQFVPQGNETKISKKQVTYDASEQSQQRIRDLEQELVKKQEHLQVTIEELETTNEELQSTNEELMSANEEMQSTNEELQSVNEELYTVNSEYQEKIALLTEANNDLDGVINATEIGIIFLDQHLAIRKFTPTSAQFIHLRDSDIGRPFHHISHHLEYADLLNDVSKVSQSGITIEKETRSDQNRRLYVRISAYKKTTSMDNPGVIVTITNISHLRFIEGALDTAREQLRDKYLQNTLMPNNRLPKATNTTILLIDDDEADLIRAKQMIASIPDRKFKIHSADSIKSAMKVINEHKDISLCLSDYNLNGETARDLKDVLQKSTVNFPIIVMSGYSEDGLDIDFLQNDIYDFLNKDELSPQLIERSIDYVAEKFKLQNVLVDAADDNQ